MFIDELSALLRQNLTSAIFIICLTFDDGIDNCAETAARLQPQENVVDQFCSNTGMEINHRKVIVFRNRGPLRAYASWHFSGVRLNITSLYKYMGLVFTPQLSGNLARDKLASNAKRQYMMSEIIINRVGTTYMISDLTYLSLW